MTTRQQGGLGLGLAIVKHLVEMHGGTVTAESEGEGRGATFIVRVPMKAVGPAPGASGRTSAVRRRSSSVAANANLDGVTVMIVDDDPDGRLMVKRVLVDAGATVVDSASATDALTLLEEVKPNVLIGDIGMPQRDGYSLIRRTGRPRARIRRWNTTPTVVGCGCGTGVPPARRPAACWRKPPRGC